MKKVTSFILLFLLTFTIIYAKGAEEKKTVEITGPVTIEFWHAMGGARIDLIQGIVDDFMKENPNITVNVQYTGSYNDTLNKTKAASKAGNAPHVFHSYDVGTLQLVYSGIITPIEDIAQWDPINWDDFFDPVSSYYTVAGRHYSMPFNSSTPLLYYNKSLFEKAGLDPESPPATFEEVIEVSRKLKQALPELKAPITWNLHSWYFEQFHCLMDAPMVNENNGRGETLPTKAVFNGSAGKEILKWWTEMEKEGLFLDVGPGWANHRAAFGSGEVAMVMSSTSDVNQLTGLLAEKGWEMGTGYIPKPAGAKGGVAIGGGSLWLSNGHTDEELLAALKLVKYISSDEPQIAWHKGTGYFPVRKTAMEKLTAEGWFIDNPNFLTAFNQLLDSPPTDNTSGALMGTFPEVRALIETGIQKVYAGDMTVEEALNEAAGKADVTYKEWNELIE
ncbi:MAG: ABC transporter substrate-binding protein [Spirochaetaceae bacterium]|nr:ABC transporter substrate-binding protein [Spirochaetaceae bacterium]